MSNNSSFLEKINIFKKLKEKSKPLFFVDLSIDKKFLILAVMTIIIFVVGLFSYFFMVRKLYSREICRYFELCGGAYFLVFLLYFFGGILEQIEEIIKVKLNFIRDRLSITFQIIVIFNLILLGCIISITGGGFSSPYSPFLLTTIIMGFIISGYDYIHIVVLLGTVIIFALTYIIYIDISELQILKDNSFKIVHITITVFCLIISFGVNWWMKSILRAHRNKKTSNNSHN